MPTLLSLSLLSTILLQWQVSAQTTYVSYANQFVDPDYIVAGKFPNNTQAAQQTIIKWALELERNGTSWSVTNKTATPPSGTKHDYLSWAPYWWPIHNCPGARNTTLLSEAEVYTRCPYEFRDGIINPDVRVVINNVGHFEEMSNAILYSTLAWSFDRTSPRFSSNAVKYIRTWFIDEETRMNPNLNYAQMLRGTNGRPGSATGVLDLHGIAKIASAILILRKAKAPEWTLDLDERMIEWSREHINWLETNELALEERNATNNHGTFYSNQLASFKLIVNDIPGALNATSSYFSGQYRTQIMANGEQPLEAARSRSYHYRTYNLAAMITNARIAKYSDPTLDVWNRTSSQGATIKTVLDHTITYDPASSGESNVAAEVYPEVAAVAAIYGDPNGTYLKYLKGRDPKYYADAQFLWNHGTWADSEPIPVIQVTDQTPDTPGNSRKSAALSGLNFSGVVGWAAYIFLSFIV